MSGLGNPLVDILVYVDDELLEKNSLNKGIMHLIDYERKARLLDLIKDRPIEMQPGGDCPNTITTLSLLGLKAAFTGKVGYDELGLLFEKMLKKKNVISYLRKVDRNTGTSIILITPDKERTMNTYLGACREYGKDDLPQEMIQNSTLFYFTGYMWDTENQKEAARNAIQIAKRRGVKVVFDVADPFAADRYREDFLKMLRDDIDIVLANAQETKILTGKELEKGIKELGELCSIAVVKNGGMDTLISNKGKILSIPSFESEVVDTTGAGDNFAAGFIYGLISGYPVEKCGRIASFVASKTIEKIGAQAPGNIKEVLKNFLNSL